MQKIIKIKEKEFRVYIQHDQIIERIKEISAKINEDFQNKTPIFLCILNGSFFFAADLLKNIELNCEVSFVKLASYIGTRSAGKISELIGLNFPIHGRDIIIIEDIVDSGKTMTSLLSQLSEHHPSGISIATLLIKREALIEKIAETDETLMEKYFEEGDLSPEEIAKGLKTGIINRDIMPVLVTDALFNMGVKHVTDFIINYTPSILEVKPATTLDGEIKPDKSAAVSAFIFKTISDPFTGKISIMKVFSGVFKPDTAYVNTTKDIAERVGGTFFLQGKTQENVEEVFPGDIVAVAKLKDTQTGDTLTIKGKKMVFPEIKFPISSISFAIEPKSRDDENKISGALQKLQEEDPTIRQQRDPRTKELVISGNGQLHVELVVNKLKKRYNVEVEMKPPKIPYMETIKGRADIEEKYKKQSGGRGQYAHIFVKLEPLERGGDFEFIETIFGGSIPKNYIPAVEKGFREAKDRGVLAGYPVVDFKVNLYDGSYHDVDSSDMAFKICASKAFKKALKVAKPTLLEPIMQVEVVTPEEFMGDINGNLSGRRGKIQGMETKGKNNVIKALVPLSEMLDFNPNLTSITGGRGTYFMEFAHYEEVPGHLQKKVIEEAVKEGRVKDEDED